jgi:hypothetical protein
MIYLFWYLIWKKFGKNKAIRKNKEMDIYLSSNIPFGAQGVFTGLKGAFVKRVYYTFKDGSLSAMEAEQETQIVINHEYVHFTQRKRLGFIGFWATIIWGYLRFWKKHDDKQLEPEAEESEKVK